MNFSTTPPCASMAACQRAKQASTTDRVSSGSSCRDRTVKSTRSANRTLTSLRCSPRWPETSWAWRSRSGARAVSTTSSPSTSRWASRAAMARSTAARSPLAGPAPGEGDVDAVVAMPHTVIRASPRTPAERRHTGRFHGHTRRVRGVMAPRTAEAPRGFRYAGQCHDDVTLVDPLGVGVGTAQARVRPRALTLGRADAGPDLRRGRGPGRCTTRGGSGSRTSSRAGSTSRTDGSSVTGSATGRDC